LTRTDDSQLPCVVLFNINGSGLGHLSTCLAYANRLRGRARPVFFSLASAIESIHEMGFEADYLVSRFWSRASSWAWDQQLALRLGMFFEQVRPDAVVFDGTWPYRGLLHAAKVYGVSTLVWSDLVLYKPGWREVPVSKRHFDLVIRLAEIGSGFSVESDAARPRQITIPPFTMLRNEELLSRDAARQALGMEENGRYALFSLGPGNLKDVSDIGQRLVDALAVHGFRAVWTSTPISRSDTACPRGAESMTLFPIIRYLRAFDVLVAAAGYNTCCEVLQTGIPTLFVPNTLVSDDQVRRARLVAEACPAVISDCESEDASSAAVSELLALKERRSSTQSATDLEGADIAADEILAAIDRARSQ